MIGDQTTIRPDTLVSVKQLRKYFPVTGGFWSKTVSHVKAVDDVTFNMERGKTLGLVGESGCGKTTIGRLILRLLSPTSGEVYFEGKNIYALKQRDLLGLRREMQIIFQDPYASLDPRKTVAEIVGEPLSIHGATSRKERRDRVDYLLNVVGLSSHHAPRYPHEFSGGQRQRIGIARSLALEPKLIVCDEPVSALDVSIQSQVLNLMAELQSKYGLTYLFISHNLSVVKYISDRIGVMYLGKIVELAHCEELFAHPCHPYTQALLSAIPTLHDKSQRVVLEGDVPNPIDPPSGCAFHTRCPQVMDICRSDAPEFRNTCGTHWVRCHLIS